MSRRDNPKMPTAEFGLLLVEGGDEEAICRIVAGPRWAQLCCWKAHGRDLPNLARLARNDASFRHVRSVGIVLDMESSLSAGHDLARATLEGLGATGPVVHAAWTGSPRTGVFLTPDGASHGAIETLCRRAVKDETLAACVDDLLGCAGRPHAAHGNPRAAEDKGWLRAYLGMLSEPDLRFHQAFECTDRAPSGQNGPAALVTNRQPSGQSRPAAIWTRNRQPSGHRPAICTANARRSRAAAPARRPWATLVHGQEDVHAPVSTAVPRYLVLDERRDDIQRPLPAVQRLKTDRL